MTTETFVIDPDIGGHAKYPSCDTLPLKEKTELEEDQVEHRFDEAVMTTTVPDEEQDSK